MDLHGRCEWLRRTGVFCRDGARVADGARHSGEQRAQPAHLHAHHAAVPQEGLQRSRQQLPQVVDWVRPRAHAVGLVLQVSLFPLDFTKE